MQATRNDRGFTLIEVMLVVALIGILAAIALPSFLGTTRKAKADSEVLPNLVEIGTKQEAFNLRTGVYFSATSWLPIAPASVNQHKQALVAPADWAPLKVVMPEENGRCAYFTMAGGSSTVGAVSLAELTACGFTYDPPPLNWYLALAVCDTDGDSVQSCYLTTSDNSEVRKMRNGE
jgi:prepilin-type N-terminal cleavage/methylation domain-containing protein